MNAKKMELKFGGKSVVLKLVTEYTTSRAWARQLRRFKVTHTDVGIVPLVSRKVRCVGRSV